MVMPQAPVPYLNRALASEQLGVDAASSGNQKEAQQHYKRAVAVSANQSAPELPARAGAASPQALSDHDHMQQLILPMCCFPK